MHLSYCSVTDAGLLALFRLSCLRSVTMFHLSGVSPRGLLTALLMNRGLTKVKVQASFKPFIPQVFIKQIESGGCSFRWLNKPFQVELESRDLLEQQSYEWLSKQNSNLFEKNNFLPCTGVNFSCFEEFHCQVLLLLTHDKCEW